MNCSAVTFESRNKALVGVFHSVQSATDVGVLIVVGGPQTRVGSHRQFVLLARQLAEQGIPSMRFDCSGMGDSDGDYANFMDISEDIDAAIEQCQRQLQVDKVVIWGLCDAASAALIHSKKMPNKAVVGLILLNPWVRSEQGEAAAMVKHYYWARLKDKAFWCKLLRFEFNPFRSAWDLLQTLLKSTTKKQPVEVSEHTTEDNYIRHMLDGLQTFQGKALLIMSGNDLTAAEFGDLLKADCNWQQAVTDKVTRQHHIASANHTFSSQLWRAEVERVSIDWIKKANF